MARLHEAAAAGDIKKVEEYIAQGDDVNDMSETVSSKGRTKIESGEFGRQMTALHLAAYNGHTQVAQLLIAAGADLDKKDGWRNEPIYDTALEIAIRRKNFGLAKSLKEAGAKDEKNLLGAALSSRKIDEEVYQATLYNKPDVIREIFADGLLNKAAGEKALRYAIQYNNLPVVKVLVLECGVSVNAYNDQKPLRSYNDDELKTPLGLAAEYGHDVIAEFLLVNGAEVDKYTHSSPSLQDCTPLREAILHPGSRVANPRLIEVLLAHGADTKKINAHGISCLSSMGVPEELDILLQHGFDPNLVCDGKRLLDKCLENGKYAMAVQLIRHGADVTLIDEKGKSYLHKSRDLTLTRLLVEKGLNIELADGSGKTAIEYADQQSAEFLADNGASVRKLSLLNYVVLSSPRLTQQLIAEGIANFNVTDDKGMTPLRKLAHSACQPGYLENLTVILARVPDLNVNQAGEVGGWTPLHDAFSQNKGFANSNMDATGEIDDRHVAESRYTRAIDLLISYGAKPIKDKAGRTPLMCMTFDGFSSTYNQAVVRRYHAFEAEHYEVEPAIYLREFGKLRRSGWNSVPDRGFAFFGLDCRVSVPKLDAMNRFWVQIALIKGETQDNEKILADIGFDSTKVPNEFCCSIGFTIMTDPVYARGLEQYQFERAWILRWLETTPTHPHTRQPLTQHDLISNDLLKSQISAFVDNAVHEHQEKKAQEDHKTESNFTI